MYIKIYREYIYFIICKQLKNEDKCMMPSSAKEEEEKKINKIRLMLNMITLSINR